MKSFWEDAGKVALVLELLKGNPLAFLAVVLVLVQAFTSWHSRRFLLLIYGYDVCAVAPLSTFGSSFGATPGKYDLNTFTLTSWTVPAGATNL
ncbi:hypothetical protein [Gloeobacter violaceus]|uniref:hypothetical protein n=1 Tax=Gloeobacter violaceus TaxID=33072 RepID=UPI0013E8F488|nr:hypothetical protein [Gloeobacter violaceus]